jgi:hypothetical protein
MLIRGCTAIREISFGIDERDSAIAAFETFRRATTRLSRSADTRELCELEKVEPKQAFLEFLIELAARYIAYRSRVAEVLRCLQSLSVWFAAAKANQETSAAIQCLLHEINVANTALGVQHKIRKDLEKAAAVAASCGDLGALSVKVVSARNLLIKDEVLGAFRVGIQLGERTSYTSIVRGSAHPSWNSEEFIFDVGSSDWLVTFSVIDVRNEMTPVHVGKFSASMAEAMNQQGPLSLRHGFDDAAIGDLEFTLQYVSGSTTGKEFDHKQAEVPQTLEKDVAPAAEGKPLSPWDFDETANSKHTTEQDNASIHLLKSQPLGDLWTSTQDMLSQGKKVAQKGIAKLPIPQRQSDMTPIAGERTKRAADPWGTLQKTPKVLKTPNAKANPFKVGASQTNVPAKTDSNPFKQSDSKDDSIGIGTKVRNDFSHLWP